MESNQKSVEEFIVELAQEDEDIVILWLYGSRGDGRNNSNSDYDLAVAFRKFPSDEAVRQLRPQLLAIDWRKALKVPESTLSIVDINLAPIPLAVNVVETSRVLLSKDDLRLINEENRIAGLWSDIQWRNKHQQARQML